MSSARVLAAAAAVVLLAGAMRDSSAADPVDWTISRRGDDQIVSLSRTLTERLEEFPHLQDDPAIILLRSNVWDIGEKSHQIIRNEMIRVVDPKTAGAAERDLMIHPDAELKHYEAWIQRGDRINRLDKSVWNIVKGNDEKVTTIVIAFPDVRTGDILGWSLEQKCGWLFPGGYLEMADDLPVMMCRSRIKTDGTVAYKATGEHLRKDKWSHKIIEKSHAAPSDFSVTVVDIHRRPQGRYAPEFMEFEPYLFVTYRGFWHGEAARWLCNVSWNEVAFDMSAHLQEVDRKCGDVEASARSVTAGRTDARAQADALHRYIRDEILLVDPFMIRSRKSDPVSVLASRQATPWEKGLLMYAMCRSLGLDVDLLGSRSRFLSEIDKANPDFGNLSDLVVRLNGDPDVYFTPHDRHCAPGELPPYLRAAEALEIPRGLKDMREQISKQALSNAGTHPTLWWDEYCRLIKAEDLCRWLVLPGNPDEVMATTHEEIRFDPGQEAMDVRLRMTGHSDLQFDLRGGGSATEILDSYLDGRFPEARTAFAASEPAPVRSSGDEISGRAAASPIPAPLGDNWLLPGELVFGNVFLHDWDQNAGDPFIARVVEDFRYSCRIPLPDGWRGCALPHPVAFTHPQFRYLCRFEIVDGMLDVRREVRLNRAITMHDDLPAFVAEVARVQAFERTPLVISRIPAAPAQGGAAAGR